MERVVAEAQVTLALRSEVTDSGAETLVMVGW